MKVGNGELRQHRRQSAACLTTLGCAVLLAASTLLTWTSVEVGNSDASSTLIAAPIALTAIGFASGAIAGGALLALAGQTRGLEVAAFAGVAAAFGAALLIAISLAAASVLPSDRLTLHGHRLALGAEVGPGAWLALGAALGTIVAASEPARASLLARIAALRERGRPTAGALVVLALALPALLQLRQQPWLEGTPLGTTLVIGGNSLPGVAPVALAAMWLIVAGAGLALRGLPELGALVAAAAGWLVNAAAALTIVAAGTLAGGARRARTPDAGHVAGVRYRAPGHGGRGNVAVRRGRRAMTTALHASLDIGALFVIPWTLVFGGVGALLSQRRGYSAISGLALGILLGPVGWVLVWLRTEESATAAAQRDIALDDWSTL